MAKKKSKTQEKANPERINSTILGPAEMRFIKWFVDLAPDWLSPDHMTLLGMVGSIFILAGYGLTVISPAFLWLASFGFVLNWFGDSTDGNLARMRHIERPRYGYFLDHSLDTITMLMVFIGVGMTPFVNMYVALFTLIAYLMMNIYVYINAQVQKKFQLSFSKLGPTEGRLMFVIANTAMLIFGMKNILLIGINFSAYDLFFLAWMVFLFWLFFSSVIKGIIKLYREEPPVKYSRRNHA